MKGVAYWDGKAINVATQWVAAAAVTRITRGLSRCAPGCDVSFHPGRASGRATSTCERPLKALVKTAAAAGFTLQDVPVPGIREDEVLIRVKRAGVCGTCRVQVTAGDVTCDATSLEDDDRAAGYVLACVSTPTTDCTVNA